MRKLLALGHLLAGKAAVALGLRARPDGWRRVVGVGLRNEHAKFGLSAFGLTPPAEGEVAALARFLRTEPDAQFTLTHTPALTTRHRADRVDVVELVFAPDGTLDGLNPHLDPRRPTPTPAAIEHATAAVRTAYNRTRHLPEAGRPIELLWAVGDDPLALRLLDAACVCVEAADPPGRFTPPDFRGRRGLGGHHLTFILRPWGEQTDLWVIAHHTGIDGMALQELLTRLEGVWGAGEVRFPTPDEFAEGPRACHLAGEREVYETLSFHDFTDLIALRRLSDGHGTPVPLAGLLLWLLSQEPEFAGVKFGSTVDVPPAGKAERDVDLVALRPTDFPDVPAYARAFTAAIDAARVRTGPTRRAVSDAELLPPWLHRKLLETSPAEVAETFGAVGLSIVKGAKVFVAPLSDVGFPGGFIAIGSADLPAAAGRRVAAITVKGTRAQAEGYPAAIRRAVAKLRVPAGAG